MRTWWRPLVLMTCLTSAAWSQGASTSPPTEPDPPADTDVGIRFEGLLPGSAARDVEGTYTVTFRIYKSPQGGEPVWVEEQQVEVRNGRMDVMLGRTHPIPMSIHEATFKFLGASVDGLPEVYPRYAIVNVVFASVDEALRARADSRPGEPREDAYGDEPATRVSDRSEAPSTWREALLAARAAGADLPDYIAWYESLATSDDEQARERAGHYEWVLPWVYDTASHGTYNDYFRGRFEGCDYMDLSPENTYVHRRAVRVEDALPEAPADAGS